VNHHNVAASAAQGGFRDRGKQEVRLQFLVDAR